MAGQPIGAIGVFGHDANCLRSRRGGRGDVLLRAMSRVGRQRENATASVAYLLKLCTARCRKPPFVQA
jgi:hypothetical protein